MEAKKTTTEVLDGKRETLKLETRQQWGRYDQERVLELEREDRVILNAEEKVRGLEDDYRKYKNREAVAEVRLRGHSNSFPTMPMSARLSTPCHLPFPTLR